MSSVTQRIKMIKQPWGGYLNPRLFKVIDLDSEIELNENENIRGNLIGLAVDYLTRFLLINDKVDAFRISLFGAMNLGLEDTAVDLLNNLTGLDSKSVINACKMAGFDVAFRASPMYYKPIEEINPDNATVENIIEMVKRGIKFFDEYGPIVLNGFTFKGAYTHLISSGDGDFTTKDTLWDFKVSKSLPNKDHTLQLLIYYLMGLKSDNFEHFKKIDKLGFFNPRLNKIFIYEIKNIDPNILDFISREVIGYL